MDQVPTEIQKIILNLCEDETRRLARLTCRNWFNYIDYREFDLYLTKQSEWPQIVERLSTYTKPISLHFHKNIIRHLKDINSHLLRLTSLTDLTFDDLDKEVDEKAEWFKLTALPNLHSVKVLHYDYDIPFEAIRSFNNLTRFELTSSDKIDSTAIIQERIRALTNLQSFSVSRIDEDLSMDVDLFDSYNPKMTYLSIYLPDVSNKTAQNWFQHLGNLKELQFSVQQHKGDEISLKSLTALDTLVYSGAQIYELNSTKLTFLELFEVKEEYIAQAVDKLVNLKELIFDLARFEDENSDDDDELSDDDGIDEDEDEDGNASDGDDNNDYGNDDDGANEKENKEVDGTNVEAMSIQNKELDMTDVYRMIREVPYEPVTYEDLALLGLDGANPARRYSYQWLTALTSLQYLNIDSMEHEGLALVPTQLNKLQITVCKPLNLSHVSRFVSLKEFYMGTQSNKLQDLSALSHLTGLECLQIEVSRGSAQLGFALTILSNLEWLKLKGCSVEISHLPNLQRLILTNTTDSPCRGFEGLTRLTRLELQHNWLAANTTNTNYTFVSTLTTLKLLMLHPRTSYDCSYFTALTALDTLHMHQISSVDDYCHLSVLTRLTDLRVWHGLPSENIFKEALSKVIDGMLRLSTSLRRLEVDLVKTGPGEEIEDEDDLAAIKTMTQQVIARLPDLYKYSFD